PARHAPMRQSRMEEVEKGEDGDRQRRQAGKEPFSVLPRTAGERANQRGQQERHEAGSEIPELAEDALRDTGQPAVAMLQRATALKAERNPGVLPVPDDDRGKDEARGGESQPGARGGDPAPTRGAGSQEQEDPEAEENRRVL